MANIAIAVHGGAWSISEKEHAECSEGVRAALGRGWKILSTGGSALDAAIAAVILLEDNPAFDAGYGSHLTRGGFPELDASVMEGKNLNVGAVCSVRRLKNPILAAKELLFEPEILLSGTGAEDLAHSKGISSCDPLELIHPREQELYDELRRKWEANPNLEIPETTGFVPRGTDVCNSSELSKSPSDTVGAVCLDHNGWIVVATSTGGTRFKPVGRVGDSPLVGCGFYAINGVGGSGCTGPGEHIARTVLAKFAVDRMAEGATAQEAADLAVQEIAKKVDGRAGIICVDAHGSVARAHNTTHMAFALRNSNMQEMSAGVD